MTGFASSPAPTACGAPPGRSGGRVTRGGGGLAHHLPGCCAATDGLVSAGTFIAWSSMSFASSSRRVVRAAPSPYGTAATLTVAHRWPHCARLPPHGRAAARHVSEHGAGDCTAGAGRKNGQDVPVRPHAHLRTAAWPTRRSAGARPGRGGKICLTDHFKPLWARNVPKFGIAHALALGVRAVCIALSRAQTTPRRAPPDTGRSWARGWRSRFRIWSSGA